MRVIIVCLEMLGPVLVMMSPVLVMMDSVLEMMGSVYWKEILFLE